MRTRSVAIVGGGIVGCLLARELLHRDAEAAIVVIERDLVGSGATRRSAGLHIPRGSSDRVRRMAAASEAYYCKLKAVRPELPIFPVAMSVVARASSAPRVGEIYLDRARPRCSEGLTGLPLRLPSDARVWDLCGGQHADVQALAQALCHDLRGRVRVLEGVDVAAIDATADGICLRLGTGDALTVDQIAIAPGPWIAANAWGSLVAPIKARVKKVVALHIDRVALATDRAIIFHEEDAFLLPLVNRGHWLFSYTCPEWDVEPDRITSTLSPATLAEARDVLGRYAPALADACASGRVFCDAYSIEREPIVRPLDDDGRIVFAGAANGSGYRLAPAMAAEAVALLQDANVWSRS
jgi:glycine/D-amino acid oxidase-like deaminating enzyme